jgi:hypothetical protein
MVQVFPPAALDFSDKERTSPLATLGIVTTPAPAAFKNKSPVLVSIKNVAWFGSFAVLLVPPIAKSSTNAPGTTGVG